MKTLTYRIIIEPDGKHFHAYVPALQGCHAYGRAISEAKKHINEALTLYLESLVQLGKPIPLDESFESFEIVEVKNSKNLAFA